MPNEKKDIVVLKMGDRVTLKYIPDRYGQGNHNPMQTTKYACEGTVYSVNHGGAVEVDWDNGSGNGYRMQDLNLIKKKRVQPPKVVKLRKSMVAGTKILLNCGVSMYSHGDYFQDKDAIVFIRADALMSSDGKFNYLLKD